MSEAGIALSPLEKAIAEADALRDGGALELALKSYEVARDAYPGLPLPYYKIGTLHLRANRREQAIEALRQALKLAPEYLEARNNLGLALAESGKPDESEWEYRRLLAYSPDHFEGQINLGNVLFDSGRHHEALYVAHQARRLRPASALGHFQCARALRKLGRVMEAIDVLNEAIKADPTFSRAWNELGVCHYELANHVDGEAAFQRAVELQQNFTTAWGNWLLITNYRCMDRREAFDRHRRFGVVLRNTVGEFTRPIRNCRDGDKSRIRVGFVSSDLRTHSVSFFIQGPLSLLDRKEFELHAFYNHSTEDARTASLKPNFSSWQNVWGKSPAEAADLIRSHHIDILFDLSGPTNPGAMEIFVRRPAPVQISWIGYPNTTGLDCIDYRITDEVADPINDSEDFHTERLIRLPGGFLCFSPPAETPPVSPLPALTGGRISFGSFNTRTKISPETIDLWSAVLHALPDSDLILKSVHGMAAGVERESLLGLFEAHGIERKRIRFLDPTVSQEDHLANYAHVDIGLDPYPYCGTTTTCEALWMGVPVVSLRGDRHASRVGASILTFCGLDAWLAKDAQDYVETAVALASDLEGLAGMRAGLREYMKTTPLLDSVRAADVIGKVMRQVWREHCEQHGVETASDEVNHGGYVPSALPRLIFGGQSHVVGWTTMARNVEEGADWTGGFELFAAASTESFSEICFVHELQRLGQRDILATVHNVYRVLETGGRFYISVPDMAILTWLYQSPLLSEKDRFGLMQVVFGAQVSQDDFNRIGLDFDLLCRYLKDAGFHSIQRVESFGFSDDASEAKFADIPISLNVIAEK